MRQLLRAGSLALPLAGSGIGPARDQLRGRQHVLNQAIADATGLEVLAGPAEATAVGNLAAQAIAGGRFADLSEGREFLASALPSKRFLPKDREAWKTAQAAYARCTGDGDEGAGR